MQKNMSSFCFVCFLKLNMLCGKSCLVLPNVRGIHYLFGKARCCNDRRNFVFLLTERHNIIYILQYSQFLFFTSQRSLHNAPIFRLLLKVAVNGTHQCDFINFCGILWIPTCFEGLKQKQRAMFLVALYESAFAYVDKQFETQLL